MSWIKMAVPEDPEVVKPRMTPMNAALPMSGESPDVDPRVALTNPGEAKEAMPSETEPEVQIRATKAMDYFGNAREPSVPEVGIERSGMEEAPKPPVGQSQTGSWLGGGEGNGPNDLTDRNWSMRYAPTVVQTEAPARLEKERKALPMPMESAGAVTGNDRHKPGGISSAPMLHGSAIAPRAPKVGPLPDEGGKPKTEVAKPETNWMSDYSNSFIRGALDQGVGSAVQGLARGFSNQLKHLPRPIANVLVRTVAPLPTLLVPSETLRKTYIRTLDLVADGVQVGREKLREALPVSDEFAESIPGGLVNGLGQFIATAPAYLVPGLGPAASLGQMYDQAYTDALGHGVSEEKANEAALMNLPAAAIDYVADKFVIGKFLKGAKGKMSIGKFVMGLGESMVKEGLTEGAQQAWGNWVANTLSGYDPDRPIDDQVIASLVIGGLTAGTITTAGGLKPGGVRRQPGRAPAIRDAAPTPALNGMTGPAQFAPQISERQEALVDRPSVEETRLSGIRTLEERKPSPSTSEQGGKPDSAKQPSVVEPGSAGTSSSATEPTTLPAEGAGVELLAEPRERQRPDDLPAVEASAEGVTSGTEESHLQQPANGLLPRAPETRTSGRRAPGLAAANGRITQPAARPIQPVTNEGRGEGSLGRVGASPVTIATQNGKQGVVTEVSGPVVRFRTPDGKIDAAHINNIHVLGPHTAGPSREQLFIPQETRSIYTHEQFEGQQPGSELGGRSRPDDGSEEGERSAEGSGESGRSERLSPRHSADIAGHAGEPEKDGGDFAPDARSLDTLRRFHENAERTQAHLDRLGIVQIQVKADVAKGGMAMTSDGRLLWSEEALLSRKLLSPFELQDDTVDALLTEEMIHRAHYLVEVGAEEAAVRRWDRLEDGVQKLVQGAYRSTTDPRRLGMEYVRMIVQVRNGFPLSEEFYRDVKELRKVLAQPQSGGVERLVASVSRMFLSGRVSDARRGTPSGIPEDILFADAGKDTRPRGWPPRTPAATPAPSWLRESRLMQGGVASPPPASRRIWGQIDPVTDRGAMVQTANGKTGTFLAVDGPVVKFRTAGGTLDAAHLNRARIIAPQRQESMTSGSLEQSMMAEPERASTSADAHRIEFGQSAEPFGGTAGDASEQSGESLSGPAPQTAEAAITALEENAASYDAMIAEIDARRSDPNTPYSERQALAFRRKDLEIQCNRRARELVSVPANERGQVAMPSIVPDVLKEPVMQGFEIIRRYAHAKILPTVHLQMTPVGERGEYKGGVLFIPADANANTVAHESAHALELQNPQVRVAAEAFLKKRTVGETPKPLALLMGDPRYGPEEVALEDRWKELGGSPYCGRVYAQGTELITMGIVRLHESPLRFAREDPEYFSFIVKTLRQW